MASRVAETFKHDLQYMLAEETATTEVGSNLKAWIGSSRGEFRGRPMLDACERAQIDSNRVVLSCDAVLQVCDLRERILRAIPVQQRAAGIEAQIDSGQRLHVTVVQRAGYRLPLGARFELAYLRLKQGALLREEADQISSDRKVDRPHIVNAGDSLGENYHQQVERHAANRHRYYWTRPRAVSGGDNREDKEDVRSAGLPFSYECDRGREEQVEAG